MQQFQRSPQDVLVVDTCVTTTRCGRQTKSTLERPVQGGWDGGGCRHPAGRKSCRCCDGAVAEYMQRIVWCSQSLHGM
eukprot:14701-Eustigmatos_ZCMA.PRE.1